MPPARGLLPARGGSVRSKEVARPDVVRVIERNPHNSSSVAGVARTKQMAHQQIPLSAGESPRIVDAAQTCPMCQKAFPNSSAFKQHMAVAHSDALIAMGLQVTGETLVGMMEKIQSVRAAVKEERSHSEAGGFTESVQRLQVSMQILASTESDGMQLQGHLKQMSGDAAHAAAATKAMLDASNKPCQTCAKMETRLSKLDSKQMETETALTNAKQSNAELKSRQDRLKAQVAEEQEHRAADAIESGEQLASSQEAVQSLMDQLAAAQNETATLTRMVGEERANAAAAQSEIQIAFGIAAEELKASLDAETAAHESALKEASASQMAAEELRAQLDTLTQERDRLLAATSNADIATSDASSALDLAAVDLADLDKRNQQLVQRLDAESSALLTALSETGRLEKELSQSTADLGSSKGEVVKMKETERLLNEANTDLANAQAELKRVNDLHAQQNNAAELKDEVDRQVKVVQQEGQKVKAALESKHGCAILRLEEAVHHLETERDEQLQKIARLEKSGADAASCLTAQKSAADTVLSSKEEQLNAVQRGLRDVSEKLSTSSLTCSDLIQQRDAALGERDGACKERDAAKIVACEVEVLRSELAALKAKTEESEERSLMDAQVHQQLVETANVQKWDALKDAEVTRTQLGAEKALCVKQGEESAELLVRTRRAEEAAQIARTKMQEAEVMAERMQRQRDVMQMDKDAVAVEMVVMRKELSLTAGKLVGAEESEAKTKLALENLSKRSNHLDSVRPSGYVCEDCAVIKASLNASEAMVRKLKGSMLALDNKWSTEHEQTKRGGGAETIRGTAAPEYGYKDSVDQFRNGKNGARLPSVGGMVSYGGDSAPPVPKAPISSRVGGVPISRSGAQGRPRSNQKMR